MSTRAIIYLPRVDHRTPPMGNFYRSVTHDKHIWLGKEYLLDTPKRVEEFNAEMEKALASFPDRLARPMPFMIHVQDEPPAAPSHLEIPFAPLKKRHAKMKPGFIPALA